MAVQIVLRAVKTNHKFSPKTRTRTHFSIELTSNTLCGKIVGVDWTTQLFTSVDCKQCIARREQRKRNIKT